MHQVSSSRKVIFSPTHSLRFFVAPDHVNHVSIMTSDSGGDGELLPCLASMLATGTDSPSTKLESWCWCSPSPPVVLRGQRGPDHDVGPGWLWHNSLVLASLSGKHCHLWISTPEILHSLLPKGMVRTTLFGGVLVIFTRVLESFVEGIIYPC